MTQRNLRQKPRISYYEPEEPDLDEYVFCEKCGDYVYEYCSIHGPLLVIPDDKVPAKPNVPWYVPRAALTIPHVFLHITYSIIPDAGLGVFTSMALPSGVRFGPYRGQRTDDVVDSSYCWQIYDKNRKPLHCIDAADANKSNWMRYVNCARHWREQNLVAYQYQGELYYRTIKIIPRFTELMVFYGSEFACELDVDLGKYNSPVGYAQKFGAPVAKRRKPNDDNTKTKTQEEVQIGSEATAVNIPTPNNVQGGTIKDITTETLKGQVILTSLDFEKAEATNAENEKFTKPADTKAKKAQTKNGEASKNKKAIINNKVTKENKGKSTQTKQREQKAIKTSTVKQNASIQIQESKNDVSITNMDRIASNATLGTANTNVLDLYIYCDYCNKKYVSKQALQKHLRFHDLSRAHACGVCKLRYTTPASLSSHMNDVHSKLKSWACEICDRMFTQFCNLKKHIRLHTGEKPYICVVCYKKFTQSCSLKKHMRLHTGEKPYKCEVCYKKFTQSCNLKKHMRLYTGEKP